MPSRNIEAQSSRIVERSVESSPGEPGAREAGGRGEGAGSSAPTRLLFLPFLTNIKSITQASLSFQLPLPASHCKCVCVWAGVCGCVCVVDWQVAVRSPLPCNWGRWGARAVNGAWWKGLGFCHNPTANTTHKNTCPLCQCVCVWVCVCNTQFNCKSNFYFNSHSMCNLNFDFVSADWPRPNGVLGGRAPGSWHMSSAWHGRAANRRLNNCGSSASLSLLLSFTHAPTHSLPPTLSHLADDALI